MKNYKYLITSLICFFVISSYIANFTFLNNTDSDKLISAQFDFESESEPEFENKNKSKNIEYFSNLFDFKIALQNRADFLFIFNISSHQEFIFEIPTSPPNNC